MEDQSNDSSDKTNKLKISIMEVQKVKRRRFLWSTLVESTDIVNKAAHKFVVRVRYCTNTAE
jgi:hypothetical protein